MELLFLFSFLTSTFEGRPYFLTLHMQNSNRKPQFLANGHGKKKKRSLQTEKEGLKSFSFFFFLFFFLSQPCPQISPSPKAAVSGHRGMAAAAWAPLPQEKSPVIQPEELGKELSLSFLSTRPQVLKSNVPRCCPFNTT